MLPKRPPEPELLPGADDAQDCQRDAGSAEALEPSGDALAQAAPNLLVAADEVDLDDEDEDEDHHDVSWTSVTSSVTSHDMLASWRPSRGRWSVALERLALLAERPINRLTGVQLNPLYHTGTIAFLLLLIVGATGVYLFFFFQYGYDASYEAVARMESQFIARVIRAVHRYASGALVIATLLHAYRSLFLEKFRGPRWLAWLTGILMTALVWLAGVTGYWLIWDVRAQVINDYFRYLLESLTPLGPQYLVFLTTAGERGNSWALFLVLLAAHVILFLALLGFFWFHIRRLKRPKWLPPMHWVAAVSGVLLVLSALFPAGMLPQASFDQLPGSFGIDPLFLFYFPFGRSWWFWLALAFGFLALALLPWLGRARRRSQEVVATSTHNERSNGATRAVALAPPPVNIIKDRCTGCTKCALDCPYGAIEMVERHDGRPHKFIAIEDPGLCVSCGICVGSCDGVAVTLGNHAPENLWQLVEAQQPPAVAPTVPSAQSISDPLIPRGIAGATVVYTCDRHARHGARPYLGENGANDRAPGDPIVVVLPCVGALPPDLAVRTLNSGAAEVRVVGCPPDDCANREGNIWTEQRLTRQRVPRLRKGYADAPIAAFWLPPDEFPRALTAPIPVDENGRPDYPAARKMPAGLSWRNLVPAVAILAAVLLLQILLSDILFTPPNPPAAVQIVLEHGSTPFGLMAASSSRDQSYELQLLVDDRVVVARTIGADQLLSAELEGSRPLVLESPIASGDRHVVIRLVGEETGSAHVLYDDEPTVQEGQVLRPGYELGFVSDCPAGVIDNQTVQCER